MCIADLEDLRESIEDEFATIYKRAGRMTFKLTVTPAIRRTAMRKKHRNNVPSKNFEEKGR